MLSMSILDFSMAGGWHAFEKSSSGFGAMNECNNNL